MHLLFTHLVSVRYFQMYSRTNHAFNGFTLKIRAMPKMFVIFHKMTL